ncbi:3cf9b64f-8c7f-498d-989c-2599928dcdfa [Thermothielavioides terrestris]|uniref:3cf9b64f-8c7f-498d-989c-2599928dcdfa n=1 Tax=Thermothielavioides terrestris TaxID=2587410 RepID=A0A3S4AJS5_9PEZI|nr:3cf9b64f-8c7f-498d-989c-2599928dcdfa [Thermothielavioides terrestris]
MSSEEQYSVEMASQMIPTKGASPKAQESPSKRQRVGITLAQKQALIDNLQLEITERARKLRANYNIHAQSLRTRIEIRVNRIPVALRKLTMGELLEKYSAEPQQKAGATTTSVRAPPVPAKDPAPSRPPVRPMALSSSRQGKRPSHEISGGDKENEVQTPQKKMRANPAISNARNPGQVLSPATSNSRVAPRSVATPARPGMSRPAVTPGRAAAASSILNKVVEGTRSTARPATATGGKTTASAAASSLANSTMTTSTTGAGTGASAGTAAARRKRGATVTAAVHPPASRPATRTAARPRASGASETSEGSASTVVRKRPMTAPPGAQPKLAPTTTTTAQAKRAVVGTIKKGVAAAGNTTRKAPAAPKAAAPAASAAGASSSSRVLRKRV